MSVYKEAWYIIRDIQNHSRQVYPDAADYGVPVKKGDSFWKQARQLVDMYGEPENRKVDRYFTGVTVTQKLRIADEGTKTWHEFILEYVSTGDYADGYISVYQKS